MVELTTSFDKNFSLFVYSAIVAASIGVVWLAVNQVQAGITFITLYLVAIGTLVLSGLFIQSKDMQFTREFIKSPFTTDLDLDVGLYIIGFGIPIVIKLLGLFIGSPGFSLTSIQVPLAAQTTVQSITQSFSAAQATVNPFWNFFITVYVAGTLEEFIFGLVTMVAFFIIGKLLLTLIGIKMSSKVRHITLVVFGIIMSMIMFAAAHKLNGSYIMLLLFIIAALFRGILNTVMYFGPIFLSFNIGLHQSNNAVYYVEQYGLTTLFNALFNIQGAIIFLIYLLALWYAIRRIVPITTKLYRIFI